MVSFPCHLQPTYREIISLADIETEGIIAEYNNLTFWVTNVSETNATDWQQLNGFQNEYRYYVPVDPPKLAQQLRIAKKSSGVMVLCDVRVYEEGKISKCFV